VEAQNGALEGLHSTDQWSQIRTTLTGALEQGPDPGPLSRRKSVLIHIKEKRIKEWIRKKSDADQRPCFSDNQNFGKCSVKYVLQHIKLWSSLVIHSQMQE
jgi:hypothetical protein